MNAKKQFDALCIALELVRRLQPAIGEIRRRDRNLADHLNRASQSVCLNLSEGRRRNGGDRRQLFAVAGGSNSEARTALQLAVALGYVDDDAAAEPLALADRVAAMTWRLSR